MNTSPRLPLLRLSDIKSEDKVVTGEWANYDGEIDGRKNGKK
jgi:hypothetical protein